MDWLHGSDARRDFEHFIVDSTPGLLKTATLLTWDVAAAEDLLQETYFRAAKRWPSIRHMEFRRAYVRRILVNATLAGNRRRSRLGNDRGYLDDEELANLGDARSGDPFRNIDERSELISMLAELSRRQRAVLVLRYFDDLSEAETADCLGWPIGTVKSTSARALDRLQRTFASGATRHAAELDHLTTRNDGGDHAQPS
jgi:RNA polymerase sigma-70 factor (sigma-E family)